VTTTGAVVIWGGTGQAKVLREALDHDGIDVLAVFDNRVIASPFSTVPLFVGEAGFAAWEADEIVAAGRAKPAACVAIGGARGRDRLARQAWLGERGYPPLDVVHPRAFVAGDSTIGAGCQLMAMSAVCAGVSLGDCVIVNTGASVDHDSRLGHGVHVAPGARIAGEVEIGDFTFVGTGAIVLPRVRIGAGAIIGAGAVVVRHVPPGATVVGNPARPIQRK
jgi:sugar O-acyltransferase (sialic acid O-acetyltransferase NeuD family)